MGRFRDRLRRDPAHGRGADADASTVPWHERAVRSARAHGALPYVVEGYGEISDAVRRGHAVLLRRERCEVAENVVVFDETPSVGVHVSVPITRSTTPSPSTPLVTVVNFDPLTARFVLRDAVGATGSIQLTPRRLQRYLDDPSRMVGVALGA